MLRRSLPKLTTCAACIAITILASACLVVPSGTVGQSIGPPGGGYDAGDPATAGFAASGYTQYDEIFTTSGFGRCGQNIPGWTEDLSNDSYVANTFGTALLSAPSWGDGYDASKCQDWAPSVRDFNNQYLMAFAMWDPGKDSECIGFAYSNPALEPGAPAPNTGFNALDTPQICDQHPTTAWVLDPYLFIDSSAHLWLAWSVEEQGAHTAADACCGIKVQELTVTGSGASTSISFASGSETSSFMWFNQTAFGEAGPGLRTRNTSLC